MNARGPARCSAAALLAALACRAASASALLGLVGTATAATAAHGSPPVSVDVFRPGMTNTQGDKYQCIRIPSVVYDASSGHLLAFAECRHGIGDGCVPAGVKSGKGGADLCSRVSSDQGQTWGNLTTLAKNAGQPTATAIPATKTVLLEFNSKSGAGCSRGSCCPVFQMSTTDGGLTWSKVTSVLPTEQVAWPARVGPGRGIELRASNPHKPGRLINSNCTTNPHRDFEGDF